MTSSQPGTTRIVAGEPGPSRHHKTQRRRGLEVGLAVGLALLIGAGAAVASTVSRGPAPDAGTVGGTPAAELKLGYFGLWTRYSPSFPTRPED